MRSKNIVYSQQKLCVLVLVRTRGYFLTLPPIGCTIFIFVCVYVHLYSVLLLPRQFVCIVDRQHRQAKI